MTETLRYPQTDKPVTSPAEPVLALKVHDLHKRFGEVEVLKGVHLDARVGDVISMLGASGSGKSTFLRCINLLETPDSGSITVQGETCLLYTSPSPRDRTRSRMPSSA